MYTLTQLCRSRSALCLHHTSLLGEGIWISMHTRWGFCFKATLGILCPAVVPRGSPLYLSLLLPITIRRPSWVTIHLWASHLHPCAYCSGVRKPYMQFAYYKIRSVQDATLTLLNDVDMHFDKTKSQVRALYIDFILDYNTMQLHILLNKLFRMGLKRNILKWVFSILTHETPVYNYK